MCVPFWMLDTFLFVCVYEDRKLYLIQFTLWESYTSGCFVWPYFVRGCEKVVSKTLRRGTERHFVWLGSGLFWFGFCFFFMNLRTLLHWRLEESERGTRGKKVELFQKSRKGLKEETENVRGVRKACHDKAWVLSVCKGHCALGQEEDWERTINLVSIVASVKLRNQLLIIHYELGATRTSSQLSKAESQHDKLASELTRKCQFWYPSDLICNYLR